MFTLWYVIIEFYRKDKTWQWDPAKVILTYVVKVTVLGYIQKVSIVTYCLFKSYKYIYWYISKLRSLRLNSFFVYYPIYFISIFLIFITSKLSLRDTYFWLENTSKVVLFNITHTWTY